MFSPREKPHISYNKLIIPREQLPKVKPTPIQEKYVNWLHENNYPYTPDGYVNAARSGDLEVVQIYLDAGMNINARNALNQTAVLAAAISNQLDVVTLLIYRGANVNMRNSKNETPLILATARNYGGMVNMLIDAKADINNENL